MEEWIRGYVDTYVDTWIRGYVDRYVDTWIDTWIRGYVDRCIRACVACQVHASLGAAFGGFMPWMKERSRDIVSLLHSHGVMLGTVLRIVLPPDTP